MTRGGRDRLALGLAALATAAASQGGAEPPERAAMGTAVTCRIETAAEGGMLVLTGLVESDRPLAGHASLDVGARGGAGALRNVQRTAFAIVAADGIAVVGRVGLRVPRGAAVTARLRIEWDGGAAACGLP